MFVTKLRKKMVFCDESRLVDRDASLEFQSKLSSPCTQDGLFAETPKKNVLLLLDPNSTEDKYQKSVPAISGGSRAYCDHCILPSCDQSHDWNYHFENHIAHGQPPVKKTMMRMSHANSMINFTVIFPRFHSMGGARGYCQE
jgi:hypothetical protein